jgi:SMODS and SLOG-associating 2TM effector domain 1
MTQDRQRRLELYARCRHEDQLSYYTGRARTYERALAQLGVCSAVVLVAGSTTAALAGKGVAHAQLWAILAAVLPALVTVVTAYGALFAFEQQAKLYGDAAKALQRLKRDAPDLAHADDPDESLRSYVEQVETVFRREQAQWGQFVSEQKPPASPT